MSTTDTAEAGPQSWFGRVRGMLLAPQIEWRRIAQEEPAPLLGSYVAPLAALAAAAGVLKGLLDQFRLDSSWSWLPISAALSVVFALLAVALIGRLANFFAPRFGGERNEGRARQLAAYAATAALVGGVTVIIPWIAPLLVLAGLAYSAILFGMGARAMLQMPEERVPAFLLSVLGAAALVAVIAAMLVNPLLERGRTALASVTPAIAAPTSATTPSAEPRRSEVELARLARSGGSRAPIDPARLEEQLPQTLPGGFALSATSSGTPQGLPEARGIYASEGAVMAVQLVHLGAVTDFAAAAALLDVPEASAGGYVRRDQTDGRLFVERAEGDAVQYVVIGRGVALRIEGSGGVTVDRARSAVETLGIQRLEHLFGS
jgi:energy-converting hydrogenase Eha subunit A